MRSNNYIKETGALVSLVVSSPPTFIVPATPLIYTAKTECSIMYIPWSEFGMIFFRHKLKYLGVSERVMSIDCACIRNSYLNFIADSKTLQVYWNVLTVNALLASLILPNIL